MLDTDARLREESPEAQTTNCMYVILFPAYVAERIENILDEVGVPGYSRAPDVVGRGPRGRHFNNPIWPGAIGEIFTAVDSQLGNTLMQRLTALNATLQDQSRGINGLHVLSWPCQVLA